MATTEGNVKSKGMKNISLETCDFNNKKKRINSSRSKEAIANLGINMDRLYQLSLEEYLAQHPELKNIPKDLQQKKYDHYEEKRKEFIKNAIDLRKNIIDKEEKKNNKNQNSPQENQKEHEEEETKSIRDVKKKLSHFKKTKNIRNKISN